MKKSVIKDRCRAGIIRGVLEPGSSEREVQKRSSRSGAVLQAPVVDPVVEEDAGSRVALEFDTATSGQRHSRISRVRQVVRSWEVLSRTIATFAAAERHKRDEDCDAVAWQRAASSCELGLSKELLAVPMHALESSARLCDDEARPDAARGSPQQAAHGASPRGVPAQRQAARGRRQRRVLCFAEGKGHIEAPWIAAHELQGLEIFAAKITQPLLQNSKALEHLAQALPDVRRL